MKGTVLPPLFAYPHIILFRLQDLLFPVQDIIRQYLCLHFIKSQPGDGLCKSLPGFPLFFVEQDDLFHSL